MSNKDKVYASVFLIAFGVLIFALFQIDKLNKTEKFSIRTYNEHSYVFYSMGENRSITHDPDCPCQK